MRSLRISHVIILNEQPLPTEWALSMRDFKGACKTLFGDLGAMPFQITGFVQIFRL
jgi:hypothetical protein